MTLFEELKKDRKKDDYSNEIKTKLYKDCVGLIKTTNNLHLTECIYTVPPFMLGYPTYDAEEICRYIGNKLKREKLKIKFLSKTEIFVKWG